MSSDLTRRIPGRLTTLGLALPEGLSYEEWEAAGHALGNISRMTAWALGDWCSYGFWNYGKQYEGALEATGLEYGTLRNYASVSSRFDQGRRRASLSFAHHRAVASLVPEAQDQWLERAERERLSTHALEALLREDRQPAVAPPATDEPDLDLDVESVGEPIASEPPADRDEMVLEQVTLTVESDRAQRWNAAAAATGQTFAEWARVTLDEASEERSLR